MSPSSPPLSSLLFSRQAHLPSSLSLRTWKAWNGVSFDPPGLCSFLHVWTYLLLNA